MKTLIRILGFLLIATNADCQVVLANFSKHYIGTINKNIPISVELTKLDTSFYGNYFYKKVGIPLKLNGLIDVKNKFELKEYNNKEKLTGIFEGEITKNGNLRGTWYTADRKKKFPFELKEDNSESLACEYYAKKSTKYLKDNHGYPSISHDFSMFYPVRGATEAGLKGVQKLINAAYFNKDDVIGRTPYKSITNKINAEIVDYVKFEADFDENIGEAFMYTWEYQHTLQVDYNQDNIFCFDVSFYEYTGGAHGIFGTSLYVVDLKTGKTIELDDIFVGNYQKRLLKIIEKQLREDYCSETAKDLIDCGFFDNKIPITENFTIDREGIHFIYNVYEITPYAMGAVSVRIPMKEIKPLLGRSSIVRRILKKQ